MVKFANVLVVLLALLGPTMVFGIHRHHPTRTPSTHTGHHPTPTPPRPSKITTHNVTEFGAAGDGKTDDSKAFQLAWTAACKIESGSVTVTVPGGKTFLVSPIEFKGPCKSPSITFKVLGNIVAPQRSEWKDKEADEWMKFHVVDGLTVLGNGGLIDGQGDSWWTQGRDSSRPTALRFSHCNKLQVIGLKSTNSQKNHVSINNCSNAILSHLHMTAPPKSPNTDGIDISHSTNINIQNSVMATGDDCIAINGGTSNVSINNIACGPGHGISIGSLGKDGTYDEVESIRVTNSIFIRTENGVRIKTWQGGSGFAKNIIFKNITFVEADNPVIIDQYYCPHKTCANKKSAVRISDVRYIGLHGTSTCKNSTINLSCSKSLPCTNIILDDVDIKSVDSSAPTSAECINAHGSASGCTDPVVNCLLK